VHFSDDKSSESRNWDEEDFEIRVEDVVKGSTQAEDRPRTRSSGPVTNESADVEDSGKLGESDQEFQAGDKIAQMILEKCDDTSQ